MKLGFRFIYAIVAVLAGLIVLQGYFFDIPILNAVRLTLLRWAVALVAVALVVGLLNLLSNHWDQLSRQSAGWQYSGALILFFLLALAIGLLFGPSSEVTMLLFTYVQAPVEGALMALLAVSLAVAGFRLLSRKRDIYSVVFLVTALLVILGTAPWPFANESELVRSLGDLRAWISQVWAVAGARGILLGMALGAIATGLRVLLASDRPYEN